MKFLNNKKSRRRGIAIELAITVLVIVVGLSTIIVSTALLQNATKNRISKGFARQLQLDQIGESFCTAVANNDVDNWENNYSTEYTLNTVTENNSYTLNVYDGATLLLRVVLTENDASYKITEWEYE